MWFLAEGLVGPRCLGEGVRSATSEPDQELNWGPSAPESRVIPLCCHTPQGGMEHCVCSSNQKDQHFWVADWMGRLSLAGLKAEVITCLGYEQEITSGGNFS